MTQTHDESKENAAGSDVRAGAPLWSVCTVDSPLIPNTPRAASGRGVFVFSPDTPTSSTPHITYVSPTHVPSQGPAAVAGPIIAL